MEDMVEGWQELILDMMGEGAGEKEVMVACLGKSYAAWKRLQTNDDEFRRIVSFGKVLAQAWWEKQARENLKSRYFQTGLWSMNMKNRFGWTDKQQFQLDMGDSLYEKFRESKTPALKAEAEALLKKFGLGALDEAATKPADEGTSVS